MSIDIYWKIQQANLRTADEIRRDFAQSNSDCVLNKTAIDQEMSESEQPLFRSNRRDSSMKLEKLS